MKPKYLCRCCGDEADKISKAGKLVGAFCRECWAELKYDKIPNVVGQRTDRLSSKQRLRYLQDQAHANKLSRPIF